MKKKLIISACVGILFFLISIFDVGFKTNSSLQDSLFQKSRALDGNIVIIGIDDETLVELDNSDTWKREAITKLLKKLNSGTDTPAAIGIDILFSGYIDETVDDALVEAAKIKDNVYFACAANYRSTLVVDESGTYIDDYYVSSFTEPFKELKEASNEAHINAMTDTDGIVRHAMLNVELNDGKLIKSMPLTLAQKYAEINGYDDIVLPHVNKENQYYLSYNQTPGGYYDYINLVDVIRPSSEEGTHIDASYFEDKIVLVGPYAVGLSDSYYTAIDHSEMMYGVEIMANMTDQLLNKNYKYYANDIIQSILILIVIGASFFLYLQRKQIISIIVFIVEFGLYILIAKLMYNSGIMLDILYFPVALVCAFLASIILNITFATLEKYAITNTFKRYVAPEIVHELLKTNSDALSLGGKEVDIAVLFVDIRGFTTMSELLEPKQVVEILNKYLSLTSRCIMKNNGTLDKFVGDATMAFWNAPIEQNDYEYNAVLCAIDMVNESKILSDELEKEFGRTVSFGIGVHVGKAVVGNIGAEMRMDYTAIGDTVNTAARLEANAPGGKILISRELADRLKDRIVCNSLGDSIKLKGKKDGFEILELIDIKKS